MSDNFHYKEIDEEGLETLLAISKADRFNRWMYKTIRPYIHGKILEIGSGIGNISQYFLDEKKQIAISDIRQNYLSFLTKEFTHSETLQGVHKIDLTHPDFEQKHTSIFHTFDSVFALNVIEHIKNDELALANCKKFLKPGGNLLILVPAYPSLYNVLDKELFHYRRYTKSMLESQLIKQGFIVSKTFFFNALGIVAWMFGGLFIKQKTISSRQMNAYNNLVPFARLIDTMLMHKTGLSLIVVATAG